MDSTTIAKLYLETMGSKGLQDAETFGRGEEIGLEYG